MKLGVLAAMPVVVTAVVGLVGCASESAQLDPGATAQSSSPIVGGTAYSGHPAVMEVMIDGTGYYGTCTGTLIAPDVVLTAAHCMEDYVKNSESARVANVQTPDRDTASQWTTVSAVEVHPTWWTQKYINEGHDCSILKLSKPIAGVTPIPVYRGANPTVDLAAGHAITMIGYGNNDGSAGTGAGTKRKATSTIASVVDGVINAGQPGTTTCQGDSGGGLLSTINGSEQVIGVTSYGAAGCIEAGAFTNVSKTCLDLIRKYVPDDGTTPPPGSCTPACSGKVCGPDGCGGVCGACATGNICTAGACVPDAPPPTHAPCSETEPNNDTSSVNQLCAAGTYAGDTSGTDYDYLGFTVVKGKTATVAFDSRSTNANVVLFRKSGTGWTNVGTGPAALTTKVAGSYIAIFWSTDGNTATYSARITK